MYSSLSRVPPSPSSAVNGGGSSSGGGQPPHHGPESQNLSFCKGLKLLETGCVDNVLQVGKLDIRLLFTKFYTAVPTRKIISTNLLFRVFNYFWQTSMMC